MTPDIQKILYATDLSEGAKSAIWYATGIAEKYGARVTLLHVVPDVLEEMSEGAGMDLQAHFGEARWREFKEKGVSAAMRAARDRLRAVCEEVASHHFGDSCPLAADDVVIKSGQPAREIIDLAENEDFDLVVMGTHGHGVIDALLGSVAAKVVGRCPKPVLVVKTGA